MTLIAKATARTFMKLYNHTHRETKIQTFLKQKLKSLTNMRMNILNTPKKRGWK